jgi:hypothetical protein
MVADEIRTPTLIESPFATDVVTARTRLVAPPEAAEPWATR